MKLYAIILFICTDTVYLHIEHNISTFKFSFSHLCTFYIFVFLTLYLVMFHYKLEGKGRSSFFRKTILTLGMIINALNRLNLLR